MIQRELSASEEKKRTINKDKLYSVIINFEITVHGEWGDKMPQRR